MTRCAVILFGLLLCHPCSRATTYVVAPDGSGDFPTIQAAVDGASANDRIELTAGTFRGDGNWDVYVDKWLTIRGKDDDPAMCVIDCLDDEPHRAFQIPWIGGTIEGITMCNGSANAGGAVSFGGIWSHLTLINCVFINNTAAWGGAVGADGPVTLTNCTFYGNASEYGACVCAFDWGYSTLDHCILAFSTYGTAFSSIDQVMGMTCCDIFGNAGGDYVGVIADLLGVDGNICMDPLFCDPSAFDLSLQEDSPCAPFSPPNPECDLIGAMPVSCGSTGTQTRTWGAIKALYR